MRSARVGIVVLAAVLVLALVGAGWTGWKVRSEQHRDDAAASALAAGRDAAVAFTSYDYRHLDDDLDAVAAHSTGKFKDQFTKALGALTEAIKKAKGVSTGHVVYAGLVKHASDSAVVLAAVDASITNTASTKPTTRRYRLQITLERSSGSWLISNIAPVA
jgi:Mce-associated membrane protein